MVGNYLLSYRLKYSAVLELCVFFLEIQCLSALLHVDSRLCRLEVARMLKTSNKSEVLTVKEADCLP